MVPEVKTKLCEKLRSGEYVQGQSLLRVAEPGGREKWCCLGVFTDIVAPEKWEKAGLLYGVAQPDGFSPANFMPTNEVLALGGLSRDEAEVLAKMNDSGQSFRDIAAHIEANL